MQIVQVDKEISEISSQTAEEHPIAEILSQGHEEDAHPLIELFIRHPEELHGGLANLQHLALLEDLSGTESVLFDVQLFPDFLPLARAKCLPDVLGHVGQDKSIHRECAPVLRVVLMG